MLAACTDDFHAAEGGWTEATLTKPAAVSHVEYYPREGFLSRSAGGRFVGVVKGSLREVTLATIPSTPQLQWNGLGVAAEVRGRGEVFAAVKYVGPDGGFGNVAEIKLYTGC